MGVSFSAVTNMMLSNVQHRVNLFLRTRAKAAERGFVPAISVDNIPSSFLYLVFTDRDWFRELASKGQIKYTARSQLHEFSGTCAEMVPFFGKDIEITEGGGLDGMVTVSVDGPDERCRPYLKVTSHQERNLAAVTLRSSPSRPGTLLVIFGGLEWWDPDSAKWDDGKPSWDTKLNWEQQHRLSVMFPNDGTSLE